MSFPQTILWIELPGPYLGDPGNEFLAQECGQDLAFLSQKHINLSQKPFLSKVKD